MSDLMERLCFGFRPKEDDPEYDEFLEILEGLEAEDEMYRQLNVDSRAQEQYRKEEENFRKNDFFDFRN